MSANTAHVKAGSNKSVICSFSKILGLITWYFQENVSLLIFCEKIQNMKSIYVSKTFS